MYQDAVSKFFYYLFIYYFYLIIVLHIFTKINNIIK